MPDAPEAEDDPYEEFSKALDAAREAADKMFGKKEKPDTPDTLKAANELTRRVFAERRKAAAHK